jgi:tryptophan 2,3-dioxygenase
MAATDHDHIETVRKMHGECAGTGKSEGMRILRQFAEK